MTGGAGDRRHAGGTVGGAELTCNKRGKNRQNSVTAIGGTTLVLAPRKQTSGRADEQKSRKAEMHKQANGLTDKQTNKQTDGQTDKRTNGRTDKQTNGQAEKKKHRSASCGERPEG